MLSLCGLKYTAKETKKQKASSWATRGRGQLAIAMEIEDIRAMKDFHYVINGLIIVR